MVRNNRNLRLPVSVPLFLVMPLALVVLLGGCGQSLPSGSLPTSSPVIKGTFTEYSLPMSGSNATSIVTGPDSNIWFTEVAATNNGPISKIVRITPTGTISEFPQTPLKGNFFSITAGPDGNLWFTDGGFSTGGKIGHITPTGTIKEFPLPASNGDPGGITAGPDGNLWFTFFSTSQNSKIERITPTGAIKEFSLPPTVAPGSITAGPDGNLWFTETIIGPKNVNVDNTVRKIGRITPTGTITEFPLTKGSTPGSITAGPDGNVWFTEDLNSGFSGSIARITPTGSISEFLYRHQIVVMASGEYQPALLWDTTALSGLPTHATIQLGVSLRQVPSVNSCCHPLGAALIESPVGAMVKYGLQNLALMGIPVK